MADTDTIIRSGDIPERLHIGMPSGKLMSRDGGDAGGKITYNEPFPTPDGNAGMFGQAWGGVMHTEVGFEHNVIVEFNTPAMAASAFFSIDMETGHIHQYGPLGLNWMAWTQVDGNPHWRGVEHEDHGDDTNPIDDVQLWSSAQVFEAMSAFDGWPLKPTDSVTGRGIIFHVDGGAAWGGHNCPGSVRMAQRPELIRRALLIRKGVPASPLPSGSQYIADGKTSAHQLAAQQNCAVSGLWFATAKALEAQGKKFGDLQDPYIDRGNWDDDFPSGMNVWVP